MQIKEIMTNAPTCCAPDTTLDKVARLMLEHDCGEIPVCDGTKLVGVITDRDIACRAFAKRKNPLETPVSGIMTKKLFTVTEDENVDDAAELMEEHQVRRLPVTRDGKIVGIVSQADLVAKLPTTKVTALLRAISRPSHVSV
jgi:CBS domain-containing protein